MPSYVANFAGRTEVLRTALVNIRAACHRFIAALEEAEAADAASGSSAAAYRLGRGRLPTNR